MEATENVQAAENAETSEEVKEQKSGHSKDNDSEC